jgi:hypothetical protein
LLGPIGSGAYGEVWLARNVVGTLRAVKVIRRDRHASAELTWESGTEGTKETKGLYDKILRLLCFLGVEGPLRRNKR